MFYLVPTSAPLVNEMVGIVVTCMQDKDQLCREKKKKKGPERRDSPSNEATTVHYTIEFPLILRERDTTANVLSIYTEKSHPSVHTSLLVSLSHYQLIARVIVFWPLPDYRHFTTRDKTSITIFPHHYRHSLLRSSTCI